MTDNKAKTNKVDHYRLRIWLKAYIKESHELQTVLKEEFKTLSGEDAMKGIDLNLLLILIKNKATSILMDLRAEEGVEELYD
jgi:hypothetical protein